MVRMESVQRKYLLKSLNPCFRGSWFDGKQPKFRIVFIRRVLILVFVEVGLMEVYSTLKSLAGEVLILVFVEVGLMDVRQ